MTDEVRYKSGDPHRNAHLRLALLQVWNSRCYWCRKPHEFTDIEIDHIIPRTWQKSAIDELVEKLLGVKALAAEYDVDAPENLAPICHSCNKRKGDKLYAAPLVATMLQEARKKASDVAKRVKSFGAPSRVAQALMAVTTADLADGKSQQALAEFAPLLDTRLRALDYTTTDRLWGLAEYYDNEICIVLTLDQQGRHVRDTIDVLTGLESNEALLNPIDALVSEISNQLRSDIESQLEDEGCLYADVGQPITRIDIKINDLRYVVYDQQFKMTGTFYAIGYAEATVTNASGSSFDCLQRDSDGHGKFAVWFWMGRQELEGRAYVDWNSGYARRERSTCEDSLFDSNREPDRPAALTAGMESETRSVDEPPF